MNNTRKPKPQPPPPGSLHWEDLQNLLTKPIAFHRILCHVAGGALPGLFLSQALYWTRIQDALHPELEGWFYKKREEWTDETCLTRSQQERVRAQLRHRGLLKEKRCGQPNTLHYQIQREALLAALEQLRNQQPGLQPATAASSPRNGDISPSQRQNPAVATAGSSLSILSETTAETTAESTTTADVVVASPKSLIEALKAAGVSHRKATELAETFPASTQRQLGYLPHRDARDKAALLVRAITEDWAPPGPWLEQQERLRAEAEAAANKRIQADRRRAEKAARDAEADRLQREGDQLDALFKQLPEDQQAQIDAEAQRRLGLLGQTNLPVAARLAMRRNVLRELIVPPPPRETS